MNFITRTIILFLIFITEKNVIAQHTIDFAQSGYTAAFEKSKKENKPVFFMCYASWCSHCSNMKEKVFTDSSVANFYNQHFICIQQDMELGEGVALRKKFKIKSYPTFIFLDSSATTLYRITGEFTVPVFINEGKNALTSEKQLPFLKTQFEKDASNSNNCYAYLLALKNGDLDYSDVVKTYFSTQSEKQLLSKVNWKIIAEGIKDINSREFQFVLSHQKEFVDIASSKEVETKIFSLVKEKLNRYVVKMDTVNYFNNRKTVASTHLYKVDSLLFMYDIKLYEQTGNWNAYKIETMELTETYACKDYLQLKEIANIYLEHFSNSVALKQAVKWANQSIVLHEEYTSYILSSKLYQKINDVQHAIEKAKEGKELALKYNWDYSEADSLLKNFK